MSADQTTIEALRRWSHILLWVSIILPSLGAVAAARYYVEREDKRLSAKMSAEAFKQQRNETDTVRADASKLKSDLLKSQQELNQLREKNAPRRVTPEQRQAMLPVLRRLSGQAVALGCRMMDGESCDYAQDLRKLFLDAGCTVPEVIRTAVNDSPGHVVVSTHGHSSPEVLQIVAEALKAGNIPTRLEDIPENQMGLWYQNIVHVVVGRRAR